MLTEVWFRLPTLLIPWCTPLLGIVSSRNLTLWTQSETIDHYVGISSEGLMLQPPQADTRRQIPSRAGAFFQHCTLQNAQSRAQNHPPQQCPGRSQNDRALSEYVAAYLEQSLGRG